MRAEWRAAIAAGLALAAAALFAAPYARLAAPYCAAVDRLVARAHPWTIDQVAVAPDPSGRGTVLHLVGEVRRARTDPRPAVVVESRVQIGEVIEIPIVFWTLLLLWPAASPYGRALRLASGVAVFLCLEALTTAVELLEPLADASAILLGEVDPLTPWERWSRFLESGGNVALAAAGALAALALANVAARALERLTAVGRAGSSCITDAAVRP
jgi:hypothetical protein